MPVLHIHTNISIENQSDFLAQASSTVSAALGKPESYVMILFSECKPMLFAGTQEPAAFVELKSLGLNEAQTKGLSDKLCSFLETTLNIEPSRMYIEFSNPERAMFGWNKSTF
ncbi:MAG: phenylpyruvate tautomerase MIF-related protein [Mariprofundaceae bacterium]|nr:phenylpyruvate tautomerase MIF-related protein [Mariprofundaceae bacterium]